jgi:hypothetical protein
MASFGPRIKDEQMILEYKPTLYRGPQNLPLGATGDDGFKGGPGPYSYEAGGPINLRPFWKEPRNLLLHNMYIASEIQLGDRSKIQANVLGNAAMLAFLLAVCGEKGVHTYAFLQAGAWTAWCLDLPILRDALTSPELREAVFF